MSETTGELLERAANALDAAWEQLTCTCETPPPDSGVCDCAIAQVGAALDALRVRSEEMSA